MPKESNLLRKHLKKKLKQRKLKRKREKKKDIMPEPTEIWLNKFWVKPKWLNLMQMMSSTSLQRLWINMKKCSTIALNSSHLTTPI